MKFLVLILLLPLGCHAQVMGHCPKSDPDDCIEICDQDDPTDCRAIWNPSPDGRLSLPGQLSLSDAVELANTIRGELAEIERNPMAPYLQSQIAVVQHDLDELYSKKISTPYVDRVRKLGQDYAALVAKDEELQGEDVL